MKSPKNREIEIKLQVPDLTGIRRRLRRLGARILQRVEEQDTLYDTARGQFARTGKMLRVRRETAVGSRTTGHCLLTYKGRAKQGARYKVREEVEVSVADPGLLRKILEAIGLRPWFRYEKRRSSYRLPGISGLHVDLDETPIGVFLELEGSPEAIDRAARLLGYGPGDYLTASYWDLYRDFCRRQGESPGDMLFRCSRS